MASALPTFRPADIVVVSGKAPVSRAIKARTCSYCDAIRSLLGWPTWRCVSHVAICAVYEGQVLLFESTTLSRLPCVIRLVRHEGMQAHNPHDWVASTSGAIWVSSLPKYYGLEERESHALTDFLVDHIDRGYDPRGAIQAGARWADDSDLSTVFCSEIVAQALMVADVIERDNASKLTPVDLIKSVVSKGIYGTPRRLK
jgi:hypothetical protein